MTILDLISSVEIPEKITVVSWASNETLIDGKYANDLEDSRRFHEYFANKKIRSIEVGELCDIVIAIED